MTTDRPTAPSPAPPSGGARYVQYGCGTTAPAAWTNFDASPTLVLQKLPVLGRLLRGQLNTRFPDHVRYGDIRKGLPGVAAGSCAGVYCSHVLEHLAHGDVRAALANTYRIVAPGGVFRCVVPDLEASARDYLAAVEGAAAAGASAAFLNDTLLGMASRPRGLKALVSEALGNSRHLWMWDRHSLAAALREAGFVDVRECRPGDAADPMFALVEEPGRFERAVALEARRPLAG